MRILTIETIDITHTSAQESIRFPLCIAHSLVSLLPYDFVIRFDNNTRELESMLTTALDPDSSGVIMDIIDNDERVVVSVSN
ncbi:hypothetical protein [Vibrio methylphosphonaticus]|uniref:hypothetical protein n=1 Tax=Vibrio methylphosphonaticus TaxID=2946866 RepID=UPI00202A65E5|nr:hypothetical protein [Vibrio methylphosphonaticus]MCL9774463.1 hypothetical protein [Vibrio methylphosphonaticus]